MTNRPVWLPYSRIGFAFDFRLMVAISIGLIRLLCFCLGDWLNQSNYITLGWALGVCAFNCPVVASSPILRNGVGPVPGPAGVANLLSLKAVNAVPWSGERQVQERLFVGASVSVSNH
jgi:hypothetical protein